MKSLQQEYFPDLIQDEALRNSLSIDESSILQEVINYFTTGEHFEVLVYRDFNKLLFSDAEYHYYEIGAWDNFRVMEDGEILSKLSRLIEVKLGREATCLMMISENLLFMF